MFDLASSAFADGFLDVNVAIEYLFLRFGIKTDLEIIDSRDFSIALLFIVFLHLSLLAFSLAHSSDTNTWKAHH